MDNQISWAEGFIVEIEGGEVVLIGCNRNGSNTFRLSPSAASELASRLARASGSELRRNVFDMLDEAISYNDVWNVSAEALAAFLTQYGGGVLDGEPDVLHGVPALVMVESCAEWLVAVRADRLDYAAGEEAA